MADLTDAQVVLLAIHLASQGQIDGLTRLTTQRADVLNPEFVYRILLTYCPYDASTQNLIQLLRLLHHESETTEHASAPIDISPVEGLTASTVTARLLRLRLLPLPDEGHASESDLRSRFLLARARQLDSSSDDLFQFAQVVIPFVQDADAIYEWFFSRLLPLLRLKYEYYPGTTVNITLHELDELRGRAAVGTLLQYASSRSTDAEIGRDLRGIVGPWICGANRVKRRKLLHTEEEKSAEAISCWQDVNDWLLDTSTKHFDLAAKAMSQWNGPHDIDTGGLPHTDLELHDQGVAERYSQAGLAIIYASKGTSSEAITAYRRLLYRAAEIASISSPPKSTVGFSAALSKVTKASLLYNTLSNPGNKLTIPSEGSISFLGALLRTVETLRQLKAAITVSEAANLCLFSSEEQQLQELRRITQQVAQQAQVRVDWDHIRSKVRWLASWSEEASVSAVSLSDEGCCAPLAKIKPAKIELQVLETMLGAGHHEAAVRTYGHDSGPLPPSEVEQCVSRAIFMAYDNATNGNRTRGGMKRSFDMLRAFQPQFPESQSFRQISKLIGATHSLSFYQLTLQHGIPFKPVAIRVHQDPIALLERVLEQNLKAYTKLDDLLSIGRNMAEAGLPVVRRSSSQPETIEMTVLETERRVTYLAITSALSSDDFDTAYSYITTRLKPSTMAVTADDTSWRAAYAAGQHRIPTPGPVQSQIIALSRRMELLSLALTLAPTADPLPDILHIWRKCEAELEFLKMQELEQARSFEEKASNRISLNGSSVIPGGFGAFEEDLEGDIEETSRLVSQRAQGQKAFAKSKPGALHEEEDGPMGLFEVARGAANALERNVKTVKSSWSGPPSLQSGQKRPTSTQMEQSEASRAEDRVRKRDMVSNMVTGGLVSGMSWVLGAPPARPYDRDDDE